MNIKTYTIFKESKDLMDFLEENRDTLLKLSNIVDTSLAYVSDLYTVKISNYKRSNKITPSIDIFDGEESETDPVYNIFNFYEVKDYILTCIELLKRTGFKIFNIIIYDEYDDEHCLNLNDRRTDPVVIYDNDLDRMMNSIKKTSGIYIIIDI